MINDYDKIRGYKSIVKKSSFSIYQKWAGWESNWEDNYIHNILK
jgi:hypothetical protein